MLGGKGGNPHRFWYDGFCAHDKHQSTSSANSYRFPTSSQTDKAEYTLSFFPTKPNHPRSVINLPQHGVKPTSHLLKAGSRKTTSAVFGW